MNITELRQSVDAEINAIASKIAKMVAETNETAKSALHKEVNADINALAFETKMMPHLISVWVQKAKVAR
jgi:uncharacterized protein (UPF0335 family)